jgi:hypothetical protein
MKITELREKYKAYLPMIYEKLGDRTHTTALKARMEADGFEYAMSEIQSIRQNWAPLDGSPPGFVLESSLTILRSFTEFLSFVRSSPSTFRAEASGPL